MIATFKNRRYKIVRGCPFRLLSASRDGLVRQWEIKERGATFLLQSYPNELRNHRSRPGRSESEYFPLDLVVRRRSRRIDP